MTYDNYTGGYSGGVPVNGPVEISVFVRDFSEAMQREILANAHKGNFSANVDDKPMEYWQQELDAHAKKLKQAIEARDNTMVSEYSADVANCALAIWMKVRWCPVSDREVEK